MARGLEIQPSGDPTPIMTRSESLAVVQTGLQACLSAVLHARSILPEKAYTYEKIVIEDEIAELLMFRRGRSRRADHLLGWLDNAAFAALQRGELVALQICIHPNPNRRSHVLESYTFTVHHAPGKNSKPQATSINLHDLEDDTAVVDHTGRGLLKTIAAITAHCENLAALPKTRVLSMNLFISPDSKEVESIEGFNKSRRDRYIFPKHADWQRWTHAFSPVSADHHSTRLKVSYMAPSDTQDGHAAQSDMTALQNYMQDVSILEDVDWHLKQDAHAHDPARIQPRRPRTEATSSPTKNDRYNGQTSHGNGLPGFDTTQSNLLAETQDLETQLAAAEMKAALSGMAQPEMLTQGDTQAASFTLAQEVLPVDLQLYYDTDAMHHERLEPNAKRNQARSLAKEIGGLTKSGQIILCQCAYSKEEGDMVRCAVCHTWQHLHCYGYIGKDDPRRPVEHVCYVCFLDPREQQKLVHMIHLALSRRAAYRALRYGIAGKADFAEKLGMDSGIAHPLFDRLKDDGHVVAASGSHKAGFKTSGKPTWVPATGSAYGDLLNQYFNPTSSVENYFRPFNVAPSRLAEQLIIPPALDLPAAATPISEKRKRPLSATKSGPSTPHTKDDTTLSNAYGTTRRGRVYKPAEESESGSESEEEQPMIKQARIDAANGEAKALTEETKLISLESHRLIDASANVAKKSHKL